jgi:hypothetical protein
VCVCVREFCDDQPDQNHTGAGSISIIFSGMGCLKFALYLVLIFFGASAFDFNYVTKYITKNQNPRECAQKRLLVLHSPQFQFEGTGSILKWIMFGLAEAVHSNRTLIWGRSIPVFYTRGKEMGCFNPAQGGLFDCLFERISTCSLSDISDSELQQLGIKGYDDSARVSLSHARRGLAAYMPPLHLRDFPNMKTIWPAALASYVFRPKVQLRDFPLPESAAKTAPSKAYCVHVRHGDVQSLEKDYPNRKLFSFDDYYNALRSMVQEIGETPGVIYLATDDENVLRAIHKWEKQWVVDSIKTCAEGDETVCNFVSDKEHPVFSVRQGIRRSEYGTHFFAARGGCEKNGRDLQALCGMQGDLLSLVQILTEGLDEEVEVARVALEAVEDINLLSKCAGFVGTGTSHFSTVSVLLAIGNILKSQAIPQIQSGVQYDMPQIAIDSRQFMYIDEAEIASGLLETSYLIGKHEFAGNESDYLDRWRT